MAEEKFDENTSDDQRVINVLLHTVQGLRIVSTPPFAEIELQADEESDF